MLQRKYKVESLDQLLMVKHPENRYQRVILSYSFIIWKDKEGRLKK